MTGLDFDEESIVLTPFILYIDYINLQFNNYLKKNFKEITPRDFTYLVNIFYHENISQRELAELLHVSESNVAQIIKRLEKNDLVFRVPDERNKSRKIINLTEKGKKIYFKLLRLIFVEEYKFFSNYDSEEVDKFKHMIYDYSNRAVENALYLNSDED
ncbi:MarR family transcriptional regulator [uncultured Methanobrevibacter sp.]|uniref:MarR family transcriptional regulator n=1 Tax=uncultured Methanobrevibacter sp. TaxID=253161 RepID=UPI0026212472